MNWYDKFQKIDFLKQASFTKKVNVDSDVISNIAYDEPKKRLRIDFRRGGTYFYNNVPLNIFKRFLKAKSKGYFFNRVIKDKYNYV